MSKREISSAIGSTLVPDFSKEEDMGGALRAQVLQVATIFRVAKVYAEHSGDIHGTEDLIELGLEALDTLTEAYDDEDIKRRQSKKTPKSAA